MSDLLSGLQPYCFGVCMWGDEPAPDDEKEPLVSKAAVREALTNPTYEQVEPAARALFDLDGIADTGAEWEDQRPYYHRMVRVAWAAAGGDR